MGSYWTSSGPYDERFYYIGANVDSVKDDVGLLLSDLPVPARIQEYAATSMELKTRDEIGPPWWSTASSTMKTAVYPSPTRS